MAGDAEFLEQGVQGGGLIAARYRTGRPGRVRCLVAIGTPFLGTRS